MKLTMMSLVLASAMMVASCGTTYNSTSDNAAYNVQVPAGIRSNFIVVYPDATNITWNHYDAALVPVDWELNGWTALDPEDYAVTFNMGSDTYYAWYDQDGNLVGTAYGIADYTRLPYAVNALIADKYKGYTLDAVQREMWKSQTAYELKLSQGDSKLKVLVDGNGTVLKEKMKN